MPARRHRVPAECAHRFPGLRDGGMHYNYTQTGSIRRASELRRTAARFVHDHARQRPTAADPPAGKRHHNRQSRETAQEHARGSGCHKIRPLFRRVSQRLILRLRRNRPADNGGFGASTRRLS